MPTYDYVCDDCGHAFEKVQKMTDRPLKKCPECSGAVHRVMSGGLAAIVKTGANADNPCGRDFSCGGPGGSCASGRCGLE